MSAQKEITEDSVAAISAVGKYAGHTVIACEINYPYPTAGEHAIIFGAVPIDTE